MHRTAAARRESTFAHFALTPWGHAGLAVEKTAQKNERFANSSVAVKQWMFPLGLLKAAPTFADAADVDTASTPKARSDAHQTDLIVVLSGLAAHRPR
nr:hypothetical protein [Miltoncostaea oceani]